MNSSVSPSSFYTTFVALVILFGFSSCENSIIENKNSSTASVAPETSSKYGIQDTMIIDSLVDRIYPILTSTPGKKTLTRWYKVKENWKPYFGNRHNLIYYANAVAAHFKEKEDFANASRAHYVSAIMNFSSGNNSEMLRNDQESFRTAELAKDSLMMTWAMIGISSAYSRLGDSLMERITLERAITLAKSQEDPAVHVSIINNQALLAKKNGNKQEAIALIKKAQAIAFDNPQIPNLDEALTSNLANYYCDDKKYESAFTVLNEGLHQYHEEISPRTALLNATMHRVLNGMNQKEKAAVYLDKAFAIADSIKQNDVMRYYYQVRSKQAERVGDYRGAFEFYKKYWSIVNESTKTRTSEKIESLESKQAILERDQKINVLKIQSREVELEAQKAAGRTRLVAIAAFLLIASFLVINKYQRNAKKSFTQTQLIQSRLQVLQSQMSPHFLFNALTGIQNFVLKSDIMEAYSYLGKFSNLLRTITAGTTSSFISLDDEVDFIGNYLSIEQMRFRDNFKYSVSIENSLLGINANIPCMITQPIVENAIVHGLPELGYEANLVVNYKLVGDNIVCTVTDNGRGRKAASELAKLREKNHNSIATINTEERLSHYRKMGYTNAKMEIVDLYEGNEAKGTKVTVHLPIIMN